jgi:TP901 family phage tail tape measure protein
MAADGRVTIETILDSKDFQKAINNLNTVGKKGFSVLSKTIVATGAAIGTVSLAAIKAGIEFESAFAGVKKTVNATDAELAEMEQGIRDMSKEMPQSAAAIASVAEAAGQLGIKNESILGFTKTMTMLGDATNMSSDEAATSLARLANITGMSQQDFDRLGSSVVALGNNLATTESEIVAMSMRIAGAGAQVGMTEAEILSFSGALSSVGIEAEAGGTAFSTLISKMSLATQKGGVELEQFAAVAGMSAEDFKKAFEEDASAAIITFIQGLDKINKDGGSAIKTLDEMGLSDIRMRDALLRAAGASDTFTEAIKIGTEAWEENTALTKEAEQRYQTMESRIAIFKNTVTDLGISMYKSVNGPMGDIVSGATDAVNKLGEVFDKEGWDGLAKGLGDVLADGVTALAKEAPKLIRAGADTVKAFVDGIYANRAEILAAAGEIATALMSGIAALLPEGVGNALVGLTKAAIGVLKPVLKIADGLLRMAAACSGVIPPLVAFVAIMKLSAFLNKFSVALKLLRVGQEAATNSAKANTLATKINVATAKMGTMQEKLHAASKTYSAAQSKVLTAAERTRAGVTKAGTAATMTGVARNAAYSASIGVTATATGVATVATKAFSSALSFLGGPIGLIITAVSILGMAMLSMGDNSEESSGRHRKSAQEITKANKEIADSLKEVKAAADERTASELGQVDNLVALKAELDTIVDANGRVKEGYEARANYIVNELARATGIEIELKDGLIGSYDELGVAIDKYLEKKRAESVAEGQQEIIDKAIESKQKYIKAYDEADRKLQAHLESDVARNAAWKTEHDELVASKEKAAQGIIKADADIEKSTKIVTAAMNGDWDTVYGALTEMPVRVNESSNYTRAELQTMRAMTESELKTLTELYDATGDKQVKSLMEGKQKELGIIDSKLSGMISSTQSASPKLAGETKNMSVMALAASKISGWEGVGTSIVSGVAGGIANKAKAVADEARAMVTNALNAAKQAIDINSPSRKFRDLVGAMMSLGTAEGVEKETPAVISSTKDMVVGALESARRISAKEFLADPMSLGTARISSIYASLRGAVDSDLRRVPASSYIPPAVGGGVDPGKVAVPQTINFYQQTKTPHEVAQALKHAKLFGIVGA